MSFNAPFLVISGFLCIFYKNSMENMSFKFYLISQMIINHYIHHFEDGEQVDFWDIGQINLPEIGWVCPAHRVSISIQLFYTVFEGLKMQRSAYINPLFCIVSTQAVD